MSILSIQSHVAYGYVGNKAATYPLQSMGYDVWPVNTVQFSNHTGYGKWQGEIFSGQHIKNIVQGINDLGLISKCQAVLSGYMGSKDICDAVQDIVRDLKTSNKDLIYLCDPVMGNNNCFVKPEVVEFFKSKLIADIVTPNQFEAETISGITICDTKSLKNAAQYFHDMGVMVVVIKGVKLDGDVLHVFASDGSNSYLIKTKEYQFKTPVNGTGDLFSALFLGQYLVDKNIERSLRASAYYMDLVLANTLNSQERELQILSVKYEINMVT